MALPRVLEAPGCFDCSLDLIWIVVSAGVSHLHVGDTPNILSAVMVRAVWPIKTLCSLVAMTCCAGAEHPPRKRKVATPADGSNDPPPECKFS